METSDHVTCCGGKILYVEGIIWEVSGVILSRSVSVSRLFNCYTNWLCSSSPFRNSWFAVSIPRWCCNRKRSFSAWVCSNEKTSENCSFNTTDGFWACPLSVSEKEDFGVWSG